MRIRRELEHLAGAINGDFGELDWMPVRYMHRTISRKRLPGLLRAGKVALVTPLRDGMNLVAKEFVAAQDPDDPGVLVLSRFAGAAEQLREALLVNPHDLEGTAQAISRALAHADRRTTRAPRRAAGARARTRRAPLAPRVPRCAGDGASRYAGRGLRLASGPEQPRHRQPQRHADHADQRRHRDQPAT